MQGNIRMSSSVVDAQIAARRRPRTSCVSTPDVPPSGSMGPIPLPPISPGTPRSVDGAVTPRLTADDLGAHAGALADTLALVLEDTIPIPDAALVPPGSASLAATVPADALTPTSINCGSPDFMDTHDIS